MSSENDGSKRQTIGKNVQEKADVYEDGIKLIDYFRVLWKWKYFIFLVTVLPPLIVGITLFLSPRNYRVTYVYDVSGTDLDLNGKAYNILLSRFYSEENLSKLTDKLRKNGLEKYAQQLSNSNNRSKKSVELEISPPFLDTSKLNITDPDQLNKIRNVKALFLNVNVTVTSELEDIYKVSSVIRNNIEDVIPVYIAQEELLACSRGHNSQLAVIEGGKFDLELALKNNNEVLAGLKNINSGDWGNKQENVTLQFNVGGQGQYLPLSYQIQCAESKKVELEENIKITEEKYKYYKDLLDLDNKILAELDNKLSSDYTMKQFQLFLVELAGSSEKQPLKDYLNSYIRRIENRMSANKPVTEKPEICPIARKTVKKSALVFAVALMLSVFVAFLLEGCRENQLWTSRK